MIQMDILIKKSTSLAGTVIAPGSKSYTHRVIAAASLYGGEMLIQNPSNSDANAAMLHACRQLGASMTQEKDGIRVGRIRGRPDADRPIDLGNSGTALRMVISLACLAEGKLAITGDPSLQNRPTRPLLDALRSMGADITGIPRETRDGEFDEYAPIIVNARGGLDGGRVEISCKESSQYLSSLLLASGLASRDVEIHVTDMVASRPYVEMTMEVLDNFGIRVRRSDDYMRYTIKANQAHKGPDTYRIPGDYSQAAFFMAAACLVDSDVRIGGLDPHDRQGDKVIVDILQEMGAEIGEDSGYILVRGPFKLRGIEADLVDAPDLFPVLSVLGIYASGKTRLYNMPQIRSKETDRISVIEREFARYGIRTESGRDEMTVYSTDLPEGKYVFSARGRQGVTDHRVAMALSLIGIRTGSAVIEEADKISVSYPDYTRDMNGIGASMEQM